MAVNCHLNMWAGDRSWEKEVVVVEPSKQVEKLQCTAGEAYSWSEAKQFLLIISQQFTFLWGCFVESESFVLSVLQYMTVQAVTSLRQKQWDAIINALSNLNLERIFNDEALGVTHSPVGQEWMMAHHFRHWTFYSMCPNPSTAKLPLLRCLVF